MKKPLIAFALTAIAASALLTAPAVCASGSCGIVPIKPITPIGCKDLKPVCTCDSRGQNCKWTWECVK